MRTAGVVTDFPVTVGHQDGEYASQVTLEIIEQVFDYRNDGRIEVGKKISLVRDQELLPPGRRGHHVWWLRSGVLRTQVVDRDGRRHILNLVLPGEIVGIALSDLTGSSVEASTGSTLHRFCWQEFERLVARRADFRRLVLRQQDHRLERVRSLAWIVGALRPFERMCAFLTMACHFMPVRHLHGGGIMLSQILPRTDVASLLNTTVETICRVTQELQRDRKIEIIDPQHFSIPDLPALAAIGFLDASRLAGLGFSRRLLTASASTLQ